jgi:hypothetical protein
MLLDKLPEAFPVQVKVLNEVVESGEDVLQQYRA